MTNEAISANQPEEETPFTLVPIPKRTRQYILSWIWLWSPLRACTYLL